jgi:hypothetical protein
MSIIIIFIIIIIILHHYHHYIYQYCMCMIRFCCQIIQFTLVKGYDRALFVPMVIRALVVLL